MLRLKIFGVFFFFLPPAQACACAFNVSTCDREWNIGETIFLGKTIAVEEAGLSNAAHFTVEESFRGTIAPGSEIVLSNGGSDCDYPFAPGIRYLVYAFQSAKDGHFSTNKCSQTRPAVTAGGELRELRAQRDHKPLDDVFGTVTFAPLRHGWEDLVESQPVAGVPVRAIGPTGIAFSTTTDERGVYAFPSLSIGIYTIEPDVPPGFSAGAQPTVEVSGVSCRVDNFARPDGSIRGTVVDEAGEPIAGFISVELVGNSETVTAPQRGGMPGSNAGLDGKFSLPYLPPGRYRLVFHPSTDHGVNFHATFYWPENPDDAIELALGQHIDSLFFTMRQGTPSAPPFRFRR